MTDFRSFPPPGPGWHGQVSGARVAAAKCECLFPARQGHCCLVAVCLASRPPGSPHRSDPLAACPLCTLEVTEP